MRGMHRSTSPRSCAVPPRRVHTAALAALWNGALAGVMAGLLGATAARADDALPPAVHEALRQAGLPASALAAVALPLAPWARSWQVQPQRPMHPASTMKLVTSVVALDRLGPNHRGHTALLSDAAIDGGTLRGDLVLQGGGDVELHAPQLWALLVELQQAGVQRIEGDLIVDRTRYRPARLDLGLPPFDDAPEFPYNVIPDALMLQGNLLPLALRAQGGAVVANTVPLLPGLRIDASRMTLVDARCEDWDEHWKTAQVQAGPAEAAGAPASDPLRLVLDGAFPRGCSVRAELQLIDRQALTERLFRAVWQGLGGQWSGRAREAAAPAGARVLARRSARPWGELLRAQNKTSDNAWTRVLFLELGVPGMAAEPRLTTPQLAERAVRQWFVQQGIGDTGLVLDNGSGLSRSERISPWQMARMLQVAWAGPHRAELQMSLPTAGVDGTMRSRLKGSPAAGWARLKTGTLRNAVGLAGYIRDPQGREWALAMMLNQEPALGDVARARAVLDALVDQFVRFGPHPAPALPGPQGDGP